MAKKTVNIGGQGPHTICVDWARALVSISSIIKMFGKGKSSQTWDIFMLGRYSSFIPEE